MDKKSHIEKAKRVRDANNRAALYTCLVFIETEQISDNNETLQIQAMSNNSTDAADHVIVTNFDYIIHMKEVWQYQNRVYPTFFHPLPIFSHFVMERCYV